MRRILSGCFNVMDRFVLLNYMLFSHLYLQFDVTFPALPCSILSLDAMDISGEQHLDVVRMDIILFSPYSEYVNYLESGCVCKCRVHVVQYFHVVFPCMQKHDIIKKRLDSHGNAIESRPDGIGAPKVIFFYLFLSLWSFVGPYGPNFIHVTLGAIVQ